MYIYNMFPGDLKTTSSGTTFGESQLFELTQVKNNLRLALSNTELTVWWGWRTFRSHTIDTGRAQYKC